MSACAKQQKLSVAKDDLEAQSTGHIAVGLGGFGGHGSKKYSSSAQLTSLAHTSALQARTAVQSQQSAGIQAAVGAQSGYARAAQEAASAAQVALVAKQVIVQDLERHVEDAEHQLAAEQSQVTSYYI